MLKKELMLPKRPGIALYSRGIFLRLFKSEDHPVFSLLGGENKQITFFDGWEKKVIDNYCLQHFTPNCGIQSVFSGWVQAL